MNLSYVFEHGDLVLIATFLLLLGMSISSWTIIFWKLLMLRIEARCLQNFKKQYTADQDWPKHMELASAQGYVSTLLNEVEKTQAVFRDNISPSPTNEKRQQLMTMYLSQQLDLIRVALDKGLTILASVGSSAPFIGLFGTVWGVYGALTDIATEGNASLTVVAGPMGEALVATALGLFTAIPAVLAYNTFVRSNRVFMQQLRHIAEQLTLYWCEEGQA